MILHAFVLLTILPLKLNFQKLIDSHINLPALFYANLQQMATSRSTSRAFPDARLLDVRHQRPPGNTRL